jgi:hypothetical protein
MHGGSAPQVKAAAADRLAAMVDPALTELNRIITSPDVTDAVRLAAIKDVLDRAGYRPTDKHAVDIKGRGVTIYLPECDHLPA